MHTTSLEPPRGPSAGCPVPAPEPRFGPGSWLVDAGVLAVILFMLVAPPIAVLAVLLAYHGLRTFGGLP